CPLPQRPKPCMPQQPYLNTEQVVWRAYGLHYYVTHTRYSSNWPLSRVARDAASFDSMESTEMDSLSSRLSRLAPNSSGTKANRFTVASESHPTVESGAA